MPILKADIIIEEHGAPGIFYPSDTFRQTPVFFAVTPHGGTEENSRLFAIDFERSVTPDSIPFQKGPRPKAGRADAWLIDTIDDDATPRLFERGGHPGDFEIMGDTEDGRPATAVLSFLDLSEGLRSADRVSMSPEFRLALARAFSELEGHGWKAAADALDPGGLMRSGALPALGGNPMTEEGFHHHMMEQQKRQIAVADVERHPMYDWRLWTDAGLAQELESSARAIIYVLQNPPEEHPVSILAKEALPALAATLRDGGDVQAAAVRVRDLQKQAEDQRDDSLVLRNLVGGLGPGSVCWRDCFADDGLVDTALRRHRTPGCDDARLSTLESLPEYLCHDFRRPDVVVAHRIGQLRHVGVPLADRSVRLADADRPWLPLHARRIAASPGLRSMVAALDNDRLQKLLAGTAALARAYRTIGNTHPAVPEAHDALALGWRVLAREAQERGWSDYQDASGKMPTFMDPELDRLPWMRDVEPLPAPVGAVRTPGV